MCSTTVAVQRGAARTPPVVAVHADKAQQHASHCAAHAECMQQVRGGCLEVGSSMPLSVQHTQCMRRAQVIELDLRASARHVRPSRGVHQRAKNRAALVQ